MNLKSALDFIFLESRMEQEKQAIYNELSTFVEAGWSPKGVSDRRRNTTQEIDGLTDNSVGGSGGLQSGTEATAGIDDIAPAPVLEKNWEAEWMKAKAIIAPQIFSIVGNNTTGMMQANKKDTAAIEGRGVKTILERIANPEVPHVMQELFTEVILEGKTVNAEVQKVIDALNTLRQSKKEVADSDLTYEQAKQLLNEQYKTKVGALKEALSTQNN